MKNLIVIGLILLLTSPVYAKKVNVCYDSNGKITGIGRGLTNGVACIKVNSVDDKTAFNKKVVDGKLVANPDYNKHLSISSDTNVLETDAWYAMSIFTDIKSVLTVKLLDGDNKVVTNEDRVISVKSTGGNLEAMSITTVNGVGTVEFLAPQKLKKLV